MKDFPWINFSDSRLKREDWDAHENPDKRLQEVTLKFVIRPDEATRLEKWFADRKAMFVCPHCGLQLSQISDHLPDCPNYEKRRAARRGA